MPAVLVYCAVEIVATAAGGRQEVDQTETGSAQGRCNVYGVWFQKRGSHDRWG